MTRTPAPVLNRMDARLPREIECMIVAFVSDVEPLRHVSRRLNALMGAYPPREQHVEDYFGSPSLLMWAGAQGCPLDEGVFAKAVATDNLEIVQCLRLELGCPWDHRALEETYSLEVMQWVWSHGCPWGDSCVPMAAKEDEELVEWALDNGCPMGADYAYYIYDGLSTEMTALLRARGCAWSVIDKYAMLD